MTSLRPALVFVVFALAAWDLAAQEPPGVVPPAGPTAEIRWPVPAGWGQETIPFPLGFAPGLPYRGVEELRFAPGWSKPTEPGYWSYTFVWWLEGKPDLEAGALGAHLKTYFRGLSLAVGASKYKIDPDLFRTELIAEGASRRTGRIFSLDAFATGLPITLNVVIEHRECVKAKRHAVVFLLSPQAKTEPIWRDLESTALALVCE